MSAYVAVVEEHDVGGNGQIHTKNKAKSAYPAVWQLATEESLSSYSEWQNERS